jgi:hypothetical protein
MNDVNVRTLLVHNAQEAALHRDPQKRDCTYHEVYFSRSWNQPLRGNEPYLDHQNLTSCANNLIRTAQSIGSMTSELQRRIVENGFRARQMNIIMPA